MNYQDPYWQSPEERGVKLKEAANQCLFSTCEQYRYWLRHRWDELYEERAAVWIGLNPSTANDRDLDPTLRRIKRFTASWGLTSFYMLNLFALRSPFPRALYQHPEPVGKYTDHWIRKLCKDARMVIVCWGQHGGYMERDKEVEMILYAIHCDTYCLGYNLDGSPTHPLYVPADRKPIAYHFDA